MTSSDKVPELSESKFDDFVKEGIVLIDFFADWCMPCLMMAPVMDEVSEKFVGKIKFGKVNVEENRGLAEKFNISSIPNLTVLKDGEVIDQFAGALPEEELEEKLNGYL